METDEKNKRDEEMMKREEARLLKTLAGVKNKPVAVKKPASTAASSDHSSTAHTTSAHTSAPPAAASSHASTTPSSSTAHTSSPAADSSASSTVHPVSSKPQITPEQADAQARREEERLNKMMAKIAHKPATTLADPAHHQHHAASTAAAHHAPTSSTTTAHAPEKHAAEMSKQSSLPYVSPDAEDAQARREEERLNKMFGKKPAPAANESANTPAPASTSLPAPVSPVKRDEEARLAEEQKRLQEEIKRQEEEIARETARMEEEQRKLEAQLASLEAETKQQQHQQQQQKEEEEKQKQAKLEVAQQPAAPSVASAAPTDTNALEQEIQKLREEKNALERKAQDPTGLARKPLPVNPFPTFAPDLCTVVNSVRADPAGKGVELLQSLLDRMDGTLIKGVGDDPDIETREGVAAVKEAIHDLKQRKPVGSIVLSAGLSHSCQDLVEDNGPLGKMGEALSDGTDSGVRLLRYGSWKGKVAELLSFGPRSNKAEDVVQQWLVDDGSQHRPQRAALLDPTFTVLGCALQKHSTMGFMAAAAVSRGFEEGKGLDSRITGARTGEESSSEKSLLVEAADGKSFKIKSEELSCPKEHCTLSKCGRTITLRWNEATGGELTHQWTLPFDIPISNISAKMLENRIIEITMLKETPVVSDLNLREYSLVGDPSTESNRLKTAITQSNDTFSFIVEPCQSDVEVKIRIKDSSNLCFESVYTDVTKDADGTKTTKTITRSETVKIPFSLSSDMFDFASTPKGGISVTLYKPGCKPGSSTSVPTEINIPIV